MESDVKTISRQELYNQVWDTPVTRLAKEYGLSDVGFAKICRKYNIPRPPRGYWAKKAAGHRLPKEPLPRRSSQEIIEIRPNLSNPSGSTETSLLSEHTKDEQKFPPIVVAKSLRNPHPLIGRAAEILELWKPNDVGILDSKDENCLGIRVSHNTFRRALRIMDALIKGLEERGFEIHHKEGLLEVRILGECLEFGISEELMTTKTQPEDAKLEGHYEFRHSRFDYARVPSGRLCLTIHDRSFSWDDNFRKNWRDTKRKQLEDSLDAFVRGLLKRAAKKKEYRRRKEEEERQRQEIARLREEERQRRAELNRRIEEERGRVSKLVADAENHQKSKQIRDFIRTVESEHQRGNSVYVSGDEYETWVKWARDQADRLDPLAESPPSILDQAGKTAEEETDRKRDFSDPLSDRW